MLSLFALWKIDWLPVQPGVAWTTVALVAALVIGSVVRLVMLAGDKSDQRRSRLASLRTWWILTILFLGSVLLGRPTVAILFAVASAIGLVEYLALTYDTRRDRVADILAVVALLLHYLWIYLDRDLLVLVFLPLFFFLVLSVRLVLTGTTTGFVYDVSSVFWGVMLMGYALSHVARLINLPDESNPVGHWPGWLLYLVMLTELNDIGQALWGRQLGRHKVAPTVSPGKTWEGLLCGMATTVVAAAVLAPLLTPLGSLPSLIPWQWPLLAGLVISIGGFFGDITMSAVKRDIGVKDSSRLLPGMGGMLDRVDSLTFTAPLFFYFIYLLPKTPHA